MRATATSSAQRVRIVAGRQGRMRLPLNPRRVLPRCPRYAPTSWRRPSGKSSQAGPALALIGGMSDLGKESGKYVGLEREPCSPFLVPRVAEPLYIVFEFIRIPKPSLSL